MFTKSAAGAGAGAVLRAMWKAKLIRLLSMAGGLAEPTVLVSMVGGLAEPIVLVSMAGVLAEPIVPVSMAGVLAVLTVPASMGIRSVVLAMGAAVMARVFMAIRSGVGLDGREFVKVGASIDASSGVVAYTSQLRSRLRTRPPNRQIIKAALSIDVAAFIAASHTLVVRQLQVLDRNMRFQQFPRFGGIVLSERFHDGVVF